MHKTVLREPSCSCRACQKYISIASLAEQLELSAKTIRRMVTNGEIKAKRIGGSIRIAHSELAKIIHDY